MCSGPYIGPLWHLVYVRRLLHLVQIGVMLTLSYPTILLVPLVSYTLLASVIVVSMVMTMMVIVAMGMAMIDPMVAMTVVVSVMVTLPGVCSWGSVRLCVCFPCALLWCLSALVHAVSTCATAVGFFDRALDMALADDGVGKRDVLGETATPVINEKVVLVSAQCLPDIRLLLVLFVEGDVHRQPLCQHGVQALCLLPLLVNDHVGHVLQTLTLHLLVQAVHSGSLHQAEQSAGL